MPELAMLAAALTLAALPALAQPGEAKPGGERRADREAKGLMRYDTNKDGVVDRAEWNAGQEARFRQRDTDRDGKLSPEEFLGKLPAGAQAAVADDPRAKRRSAFFQRVDTDKDGFVSKAEFMAQADRNFARCDADKDGKISREECRAALGKPQTGPAPQRQQQ